MANNKFSERLQTAMEENNLTVTSLAAKTNLYRGTVSNYLSEAYAPKHDNLAALANALNVSEKWLLNGDGEKEYPIQSTGGSQISAEAIDLLKSYYALDEKGREKTKKAISDELDGSNTVNAIAKAKIDLRQEEQEKSLIDILRNMERVDRHRFFDVATVFSNITQKEKTDLFDIIDIYYEIDAELKIQLRQDAAKFQENKNNENRT